MTLAVRESNLGGQLFFKALGFRAVSVLKAYYEQDPSHLAEDAYLMQLRLETAAAAPAKNRGRS